MGTGVGFSLKSRISSGGTDIVSLTIRKKTGRDVGSISLMVNGVIMIFAGILFGWQVCPLLNGDYFRLKSCDECDFHKTKENAGNDCNQLPRKSYRYDSH